MLSKVLIVGGIFASSTTLLAQMECYYDRIHEIERCTVKASPIDDSGEEDPGEAPVIWLGAGPGGGTTGSGSSGDGGRGGGRPTTVNKKAKEDAKKKAKKNDIAKKDLAREAAKEGIGVIKDFRGLMKWITKLRAQADGGFEMDIHYHENGEIKSVQVKGQGSIEIGPSSGSKIFSLNKITGQVNNSPIERLTQLVDAVKSGDSQASGDLIDEASRFFIMGPPWARPQWQLYQRLKQESEYAAWTYVFGSQINHFTVSAHLTNSYKDLNTLAALIERELHIKLNHSGGLVKGTPKDLLE